MNLSQIKTAAKGRVAQAAATTGLMVGTGVAFADGVDVTAVTTALAAAATTVGTVGAAALGVVVVAKVFKYIRSAF
jgi:hypothetical protein